MTDPLRAEQPRSELAPDVASIIAAIIRIAPSSELVETWCWSLGLTDWRTADVERRTLGELMVAHRRDGGLGVTRRPAQTRRDAMIEAGAWVKWGDGHYRITLPAAVGALSTAHQPPPLSISIDHGSMVHGSMVDGAMGNGEKRAPFNGSMECAVDSAGAAERAGDVLPDAVASLLDAVTDPAAAFKRRNVLRDYILARVRKWGDNDFHEAVAGGIADEAIARGEGGFRTLNDALDAMNSEGAKGPFRVAAGACLLKCLKKRGMPYQSRAPPTRK